MIKTVNHNAKSIDLARDAIKSMNINPWADNLEQTKGEGGWKNEMNSIYQWTLSGG